MRSSQPLVEAQIRANFDNALIDAITLGRGSTDQGFDDETVSALIELTKQFPHPTDEAIQNARQAIEFQLDGTHARERRARLGL